ncbi:MAG: GTA-gp10 family protein [Alphaproteobacteria bacterium]
MTTINFSYRNRCFEVTPDMRLVVEIESELGALAMLRQKFSACVWKVTDLVTLVQMMLSAAGATVDYMELGNDMLRVGLGPFLGAVRQLLEVIPD